MNAVQSAIFLDRDGVLNESEVRDGRPYAPRRLEDFSIYPGVPETLQRLKAAGYLLIVVTNQPDVGNGLVAQEIIELMHAQLMEKVPIDGIEVCYARQSDGSPRRKPEPGMLLDAAERWQIDLASSYMIGDRWSDIEAGRRAGCGTIFIDRKYTERSPESPGLIVNDLAEAADFILGRRDKNSGASITLSTSTVVVGNPLL